MCWLRKISDGELDDYCRHYFRRCATGTHSCRLSLPDSSVVTLVQFHKQCNGIIQMHEGNSWTIFTLTATSYAAHLSVRMAGYAQPPATSQDTVGSLLDQITNLAYEVNNRIGFVADSLEGNSPPKPTSGGNAQAGSPSTIERLRGITYLLEASSAEANRAARVLGVK